MREGGRERRGPGSVPKKNAEPGAAKNEIGEADWVADCDPLAVGILTCLSPIAARGRG